MMVRPRLAVATLPVLINLAVAPPLHVASARKRAATAGRWRVEDMGAARWVIEARGAKGAEEASEVGVPYGGVALEARPRESRMVVGERVDVRHGPVGDDGLNEKALLTETQRTR